jgi:hypothetical protein
LIQEGTVVDAFWQAATVIVLVDELDGGQSLEWLLSIDQNIDLFDFAVEDGLLRISHFDVEAERWIGSLLIARGEPNDQQEEQQHRGSRCESDVNKRRPLRSVVASVLGFRGR